MSISRRAFLTGLALPALLAPGCGRNGTRQTTLRFWNGFTGPDGRTMLHIVKRFNAENPDVNVLMQRTDWATYYKKLFVAGLYQRAPEVFVIHASNILRFAQARFLRPVDDLISGPNGLNTHDFDANVWSEVEVDGRHFSVPLDVHILGMYFNRQLFRQAGIVSPPTDRDGFLDALHKLTRHPPGGPDQWGFVFTNLSSNVYTVMRQYGGPFFTDDLSRCMMNDPRNVAALQFCVDLIRRERVAPPPEDFDAWVGFLQGKVATAFEGIYMLADLQKQTDLDFGGAPVPQIGSERAVWANSHTLCLRAGMHGAELQAAWRFVRYLSDNSLDWAGGGQIPVRKSLRDTARFHAMPIQSAFARQIPYVSYLPRVSFTFEFQDELNTAIEKALRGSATSQQALDTATANVNAIIERERLAG
ncbi:MAG TPA: ABC transporter substrate-binding protein [Chthonomonadaceae bacterium]|nr:ABC transporter substrate-binding protein [Chthonomonadaceae bacterium]